MRRARQRPAGARPSPHTLHTQSQAFQPAAGAPLSFRRLPIDCDALACDKPAPSPADCAAARPAARLARFDGLIPPQPPQVCVCVLCVY